MKYVFRTVISVIILGALAAYMMANGTWNDAILKPVSAALGENTADKLDTSVREGLKNSDEFVDEATTSSLPELLNNLTSIELPSNDRHPNYERDQFGDGWQSTLDGCNTREKVLMRDLTNIKMRADRKCKVESGVLNPDPYTGKTIKFNSIEDPMAVQIDHIVPLSVAWQMGAWKWDSNARVAFSNDTMNLLASDGPENNRKSDKTPSKWMPKNQAYTCTFASQYVSVTEKYDLTMAQEDATALREVLEQC